MGRRGTLGNAIRLVTNYVRMGDIPNATYHQHALHFPPEVDDDDVRLKRYLGYQCGEQLCRGNILCDGSTLYTWKSIDNEEEPKIVRATSKDSTEYEITITHVAARSTIDPQTIPVSPFVCVAFFIFRTCQIVPWENRFLGREAENQRGKKETNL
jgi:hypothetical protein